MRKRENHLTLINQTLEAELIDLKENEEAKGLQKEYL
jgi:hypothetical protein